MLSICCPECGVGLDAPHLAGCSFRDCSWAADCPNYSTDQSGFWSLIEASLDASAEDSDEQINYLVDHLAERSIAEIIEFDQIMEEMKDRAGEVCLVAFEGADHSEEDCQTFRALLVLSGKTVFEHTLAEPETFSICCCCLSSHDAAPFIAA